MKQDKENRNHKRFDHETPIVIQTEMSNDCHGGHMFNFSREGIYFESDFECNPGDEIEIVVEDPPYGHGPYLHKAVVKWAKELNEAVVLYRFGCGTQYQATIDYSIDRSRLPIKMRSGEDRRSGRDRRSGESRRRGVDFSDLDAHRRQRKRD